VGLLRRQSVFLLVATGEATSHCDAGYLLARPWCRNFSQIPCGNAADFLQTRKADATIMVASA
jgi:hypothetical protein